jgi:DNA topoisomerase VI subunit B
MPLARQEFERVVFQMPRATEYFDARQLTTLTGQPQWNFATVLEKELADNALDAAESADLPPELSFHVITGDDQITITITDNGPGIPPEIIPKILDFENLASDKAAYRSPTRGAQGNALKTVVGIPHALGGSSPVIIEARGVRHQIRAWLDPANQFRTEHIRQQCASRSGTRVTVTIPAAEQDFDPLDQARAVALFNPHACVQIEVCGQDIKHANGTSSNIREMYKSLVDYPHAWRKWLPQMAIPAAWYDEQALHKLISLHNARSRRQEGRDLPLGEFLRQFRGLRRSAQRREITALFPEFRRLSDFDGREEAIGRLLAAMQSKSRAVEAKTLGLIGADRFRSRFEEWYGVKRFWYAKRLDASGKLPYVLEVALAETKEEPRARHHYFGLNFSPTFGDPLKDHSLQWDENSEMEAWGGLKGLLSQAHAGQFPHVFAFHLTSPSFAFGDHSKSTIELDHEMLRAVTGAMAEVVKVFRREGERNRRDARRAERDQEKEERACEWSVKDAVFAVLKEAHARTIDYEGRKVSTRQLYYQVREMIQQYTSKELKWDYFSQTLLTDWKEEHGPLEGLYNDPRGYLHEPHTGKGVPVGTLQVADYDFPEYVFNKILYIEKKGLMPVLQSVQLKERFDLAILAGEGYATEAIRTLFERAANKGHYRLFVLHDADPYGYNIARTLAEETRRMPGYSVEVMDLGLKLEEALAMGLSTEKFIRQKALPAELELTSVERKYFEGKYKGRNSKGKQQWECERVELNALSPPALVAFLERKLKEAHADNKVIPPEKYLAAHSRQVYGEKIETLAINKTLEWLGIPRIARELARRFDPLIARITLAALVKSFARDSAPSWREVVTWHLTRGIEKHQDAIEKELRKALERELRDLLKKR